MGCVIESGCTSQQLRVRMSRRGAAGVSEFEPQSSRAPIASAGDCPRCLPCCVHCAAPRWLPRSSWWSFGTGPGFLGIGSRFGFQRRSAPGLAFRCRPTPGYLPVMGSTPAPLSRLSSVFSWAWLGFASSFHFAPAINPPSCPPSQPFHPLLHPPSLWTGTPAGRPPVNLSTNLSPHPIRTTPPRGTATHLAPKGRVPLLPLTMVFGGLGVMFYGGQAPLLSPQRLLHKVDLQSMFFFTIFVIIVLVLGASPALISSPETRQADRTPSREPCPSSPCPPELARGAAPMLLPPCTLPAVPQLRSRNSVPRAQPI